jgi:hypothetical protein
MKQITPNTNSSRVEVNGLINIYKQAVKNVPILKYSWILIATICILSFTAYFKLNNLDVFFYAILVILISFLGFLFSSFLKAKDKFIRVLLYLILSSIVITLGTAILGIGVFIIWEKPKFYTIWFPNQSNNTHCTTINGDTVIQKEIEKRKNSIPSITSRGTWKPSANIIPKNKSLKLSQFELYGIESSYLKSNDLFAAIGSQKYITYGLDPYFNQLGHSLAPIPIFNVVLKNNSDNEILITKTIYRVSKIGQVKGGDYGPLQPNIRYEHILEWKTGDQEFPLVPPFKISPHSSGSFLLQMRTNNNDIGLCWLMKIYFITSNEEGGVSTDIFQLIMTGPYK